MPELHAPPSDNDDNGGAGSEHERDDVLAFAY
jgi:hypothetical protein